MALTEDRFTDVTIKSKEGIAIQGFSFTNRKLMLLAHKALLCKYPYFCGYFDKEASTDFNTLQLMKMLEFIYRSFADLCEVRMLLSFKSPLVACQGVY